MFVGRATVETIPGWSDWALISITEPSSDDVSRVATTVLDGWKSVHRTAFFDVDKDGLDYPAMQFEDAVKIVDFVHKHASKVNGFMLNCKAGISRSAAVAKWIALTYELPFNHHYDRYNWHVYKLLNIAHAETQQNKGKTMVDYAMCIHGQLMLKHWMHSAKDMHVKYDMDLVSKNISLQVNVIDTLKIAELEQMLLDKANEYLRALHTKQIVHSLEKFTINLLIEGDKNKTNFDLKFKKREFEPSQATVVLAVKGYG